jgi:spermidine synthase
MKKNSTWIYTLFFLSGFPALIYQIIWQRSLFSIYGVNIQSITVVVADFMLGLGVGALVGIALCRISRKHLLLTYALLEIIAGVLGAISLATVHWVGMHTLDFALYKVGIIVFCLLLLPTIAMGASLPLLTEYLCKRQPNLGKNTALLYATNTLGAAAICFILSAFLLQYVGQQQAVDMAAALNILIGLGALWLYIRRKQPFTQAEPSLKPQAQHRKTQMFYAIIAAIIGFISLSYEIIWIHVTAFASAATAPAMTKALGFYLAGIGAGAILCYYYFKLLTPQKNTLYKTMIISSIAAALVLPLIAIFCEIGRHNLSICIIAAGTIGFGMLLPMISFYCTNSGQKAGETLGLIYFANIVGGTLGALLTGFVLMNHLTLQGLFIVFFTLSMFSTWLVLWHNATLKRLIKGLILTLALSGFAVAATPSLFHHYFEKLLYKSSYTPATQFKYLTQDNTGTIAVTKQDAVFGNGAYDGYFNVDPMHDDNGIFRPYLIPLFIAHPTDVLMIGLSSGSWAQVIANNPEVKHFTIVEINRGYLKLIAKYPTMRSLLHNPKVHIVIDDGRRWLMRHPHEKFNLIVMNTTFNWRAYASMLLSQEMLKITKAHLKPGGLAYYNTTYSPRVIATALANFKHVIGISDLVLCSDTPLHFDKKRLMASLANERIDGKHVFNLKNKKDQIQYHRWSNMIDELQQPRTYTMRTASHGILSQKTLANYAKHSRVITDNNMGDEWSPTF